MSQESDWSQRQLQIFKAIADNAGAVIGAKSLDGKYLYVNQQYGKLFHRPLADFLGQTDAQLFPPEIAAQFRRADVMAQKATQAFSVEEVVPVDGLERDFLSMKFPIFSEDGVLFATGLVAADISKIKDLQRQLQNMADHDVLTTCFNRRKIMEIAILVGRMVPRLYTRRRQVQRVFCKPSMPLTNKRKRMWHSIALRVMKLLQGKPFRVSELKS